MEPKRLMAGNDDLLPLEIWTAILIRVPVKSILRCRSVCKSWYSLVSGPNFISTYSTKNLNKNGNPVLLQQLGRPSDWSYSSHDESFTESCEHGYVKDRFGGQEHSIVGSCNGLICLSMYDRSYTTITFLIWNPTIRKVVQLPSRSFSPNTTRPLCVGFGFDSKANDYKVLCALATDVCEIFELKKGVWRAITPLMDPSWMLDFPNPECYLNGAVHWGGFRDDESFDRILLSFDMIDELFRLVRFPDCAEFVTIGDDGFKQAKSMAVDGLLYVIVYTIGRHDENVDMEEGCSVWKMKEYGVTESWTKVSNIDLLSFEASSIYSICPDNFRLWENGEVLMVTESDDDDDDDDTGGIKSLVLYNATNRKFKHIFPITGRFTNMCRYEESLVLM